jgi:hypothetical protein
MARESIAFRTVLLATLVLFLVELAAGIIGTVFGMAALPVTGIARLLEGGAILAIVARDRGLSSLGLHRGALLTGLGRGLLWSLGFGLIAACGFAVLAAAGWQPLRLIHVPLPETGGRLVLFFIVAGLIGPVVEEIFFRGVLYTFLRRWGMAIALIGSTALFVLPHLPRVSLPLTQLAGGLLFGLAYEKENNLLVPMVIHVLGNFAIFLLPLLT